MEVFIRLPMDGVGNYDSLNIHPGDRMRLKVQKSRDIEESLLKFPVDREDEYRYIELTVAGTVKRCLANNEYFIGDNGVDIIMSNEQFSKSFNLTDYNIVSIMKSESVPSENIEGNIQELLANTPKATVRNYTSEIEKRNHYLNQSMIFIYWISVIIFIVSIFNIVNNISYLLMSRRYEFAVLRAMGITNKRFWFMLMGEGILYGMLSSIMMIGVSMICQTIIKYVLEHVYLYINVRYSVNIPLYIMMIMINMILALGAVLMPARNMLKNNIISELNTVS
ncbi:MAG TPA: ABC transporter permease [Candidatus Pelethocola excrementipullorum]|nr:ABC transporter permease [Candidatus Pelethocola excrementipullorum]